uniref:[histone H3]-lysine(4) N-methyltransferase n=1 Tax=Monopterus albus TaxID=43700 RepID=A0A3Q3KFA8_MONAL
MAASGGGLSSPAMVAGLNTQAPARARFPGRPGSDEGERAPGGPRPVNIGLALSEDPSLLRLLGVAEKHGRQKDAGFDSSNSEEEDFTGFGTTTVCSKKTSGTVPRSSSFSRAKAPQVSDLSQAAKPLIGKIIPKASKSAVIGKIVPRIPKEDQSVKKRPVKVKEIPRVVIKLHGKQEAVTAKAKLSDEQASGRQRGTASADIIIKSRERTDSGSTQNQPVTTSAGGTEQEKLASALIAAECSDKALKVKEQGEVSVDSDTEQAQPQKTAKRMGGFRVGHTRRAAQGVALSLTSFHKRQRKKIAKGMGTSPEAGAEAGAQSGEEAAMPLECKSAESSKKRRHHHKSLYGYRKKAGTTIKGPKLCRNRTKHVFYTYVVEPVPATPTQDGSEKQLQGQEITPLEGEPSSSSEQVKLCSSDSSYPVTSGRSSRVIKAPKRFSDEDIIPFPKGHLTTWLKSQQREDGKPSTSLHESGYDGKLLQSDSDSLSVVDSLSAGTEFSSKPSPGTSHVELYKNLKKLTLKLAEKKRCRPDTQGDYTHHGDSLTSHGRKRRRPKLMMEEMDSPGVVRKLAVVVNTDVEPLFVYHLTRVSLFMLFGTDQAESMAVDSQEALEVSGPSHRIGLSGANKRMLHLLKKAKVQLIKIDQQKQLKLSQVRIKEQPLGGPRIKHVCRAAAVALGKPRAMVPDDIPRLSALPLHEREGITFSPTPEGTVHLQALFLSRIKRRIQSQYAPGGVRSRRCGTCQGCLIEEDCTKCINCLDKPKYGGPNTKRQCFQARRLSASISSSDDANWRFGGAGEKSSSMEPGVRKLSLRNITPRSYSSLLKSESEDEEEGGEEEEKEKMNKPTVKPNVAAFRVIFEVCFKLILHIFRGVERKTPLSSCCFLHCVYQEDCAVQNVWLMGGLSVLTSVPSTPQPVCLLCASKGQHEMIFCQICCEPFHSFCLSSEECPQDENKENWCCRRCKFCNVCGRKSKNTKVCSLRCQTCYHPSCLGPTYPKPVNCSLPWMCMTCIRCRSCGVTPGKTWDLVWNHEQDLCPECTSLHDKGNFCAVCHKCYDDSNKHTQMIQCSECSHWIHYKCEGLSGDYEICIFIDEKTFHADVACMMRKWLKEEELVPENQRLTTQARAHYIKVSFPPPPNLPHGMLPEAVLPPSKEHSYAQWLERTYQPKESMGPQAGKADALLSSVIEDARHCALCQQYGDSAPSDAGRLLYLGQNEWAHVNCCLWSAEVYEENSALLQVHSAVSRGRHLRCDRCGQSGATVGCCLNCVFQQYRKMYFYRHKDLVVSGKWFEVSRRVYVDFEGINLKRKFLTGLDPESINMTIGSLQIQKLGVLSELSSNGRMLYPVGYQCSRLYWSTVDPRRCCKYTCKVTEVSTPLPGEEQDPPWDQEDNHTIVHSPNHQRGDSSSSPIKSSTPSPNSKQHSTPGPKSPGYTQTRRPAGGSSRPLPSPGSVPPKSHHVLTLWDLDDTRRPRRLSSRSRCSSSPTDSDPFVPMTLRSGGTVHSRCGLFSSPPRSSNFGPASPPLSQQNSTSPVWSSPARSNSNFSAGLSPRQGAVTHSPGVRQNFKITTPVSAEVPQDFLASSETEDAAVATTDGIPLAPENLEEAVAHLMAQELPYTVFDTDTDTEVAVASMLNSKLEFDETLLTENVALHCGAQGRRGEVEGTVQDVDMKEDSKEDEHSSHYLKFSRIVVCDTANASDASGQLHPAQSISQLDGADGGSESDESDAVDDETQETEREDGKTKIHTNHNTPTKHLTVALKRLESVYTLSKSTVQQGTTELQFQEISLPSALSESSYVLSDMSVQEEEVQMSSETPESHSQVFLDSTTGHFVSAEDGSLMYPNNNEDDNSSSSDSVEPFRDDLNDPDYSPEAKTKKSPLAQTKTILVKTYRPSSNLKRLSPKPCNQQQNKIKLFPPLSRQLINNTSVSPAAATFCALPCTVTSPILVNGVNASPVQPGVTRGQTIAIRLDNYRPESQQRAETQNEAANSAPAPSPQILLVNSQGQILIKDPRSNTCHPLSTNSPAYSKISQIAKILHSSNALQRPVPRFIIRPCSVLPATNASPASNHTTTSERKIFFRVLPSKSTGNPAPTAPVSVHGVPEPGFTNSEGSTAQAIIDRAMSTHRDAPKTKPIILSNSQSLHPTPLSSRHQVRIKRVSSVTERPSRKKSKMDFLRDPSSEMDEVNESSGVRMKAPTMKDVLDLDQKNLSEPEPLRITAPPLPGPSRLVHFKGYSSEDDTSSPKHRKRTYMNQPHLRFEITSDDGFSVKANSIEVAWRAVIDGVLEARAGFHLKQLPLGGMSGPRMLGVIHDAVIFLLEQLHGAADCKHHRFRFHRCDDIEEELPLNPSGCARAEVYTRYKHNSTFDMFNFLASQHRVLPDIIGPFDEEEDEFPLKSSRRATSKVSQIHGRGLFCKRNIEAGEMVVEYAGTVIRAVLTDKREKYYDSKGIGCYMFRIDDFDVVDATMQGNAARFINHSCEPNCYSRVINVDGRKHIVIFALRKIYRGEELTYDYKFPIEDESNKLHCNCGARRCRRYLN